MKITTNTEFINLLLLLFTTNVMTITLKLRTMTFKMNTNYSPSSDRVTRFYCDLVSVELATLFFVAGLVYSIVYVRVGF